MTADTPPTANNKALALLAAIVEGDATIEDSAAELRGDGIDSIEAVLAHLRQDLRQRADEQADAVRPLDLRHMRKQTPPELVASIVHHVPAVPFILNGMRYEPEEITRFNGRELHFVPAPTNDHLLVIDDRELMARWWELTYLEQYRHGGSQSGLDQQSLSGASTAGAFGETWYWEDAGFHGFLLQLPVNRGYHDLTKVTMHIFGNWNDEISALKMQGSGVTVLHEHINWAGSTFTYQPPSGSFGWQLEDLHWWGFGDRASSLETW
jgi:hypothetical protein